MPEHRELAERAAALHALHEVAHQMHSSLDWAATLDAVANGVVRVTGFEVAVVNLRRADGSFEVVSVAGTQEVRDTLLGTTGSGEAWQALLDHSEAWGGLRFLDHRKDVDDGVFSWIPDLPVSDEPDAWHPLDALFAPLTSPSGELIGALSVDVPVSRRRPGPIQRELLEIFAAQAAVAIDHARVHSELKQREVALEHAATHDSLTGLANRVMLAARLDELERGPGSHIAVVVVDLDDFKAVNDAHGHAVGDQVLAAVARRLRACVRDADTAVRTGGDEFVLLLTGDSAERAAAQAEAVVGRLAEALRQPVAVGAGLHPITASVGSAVGLVGGPASRSGFDELLGLADRRMYDAKRARRRR